MRTYYVIDFDFEYEHHQEHETLEYEDFDTLKRERMLIVCGYRFIKGVRNVHCYKRTDDSIDEIFIKG
jgi:hypothetical protein